MRRVHHKHNLIFIVEDNEMYSFMLDYVLSSEYKLQCLKFGKGEECINSLQLKPDMIILDYVLPGIDGLETYRKIRLKNPEIPVVVLTGHYNAQTAVRFLEEGVSEYMLKEENAVQRVRTLVEQVIEKKQQAEDLENERAGRRKTTRILLALFVLLGFVAGMFWLINS